MIMNLLLLVLLQYLLVCLTNGQSNPECSSYDIQRLCLDQETCDGCLQAHFCCSWCYQEAYDGRRCNVQNQLEGCDSRKIEIGSPQSITVLKDHPFTFIEENINLDSQDIVQIKPQRIKLKLRKGVPATFTFTYKPAENYPLDLYYLGDLSQSMSQNIEVFKSLGKDLLNNLTMLTKNYKLAYGSFVDKPGMPFYFTAPFFYDNPCSIELGTCEKGYLFKHRLDFTKDFDKFLQKVENSKLTANVDDLDGALDAILQILNCEDVIGFSKNSRKIILLPTDSLLHSAGDGVLVGAALKTTEHCMLDDNGEHSEPLKYDYPSLEQIDSLIRQKKVNIIFAVKTAAKLQYYMNMTKDSLKGFVYVAELEEESKNILDLIKSGFYSFVEQVTFSINQTFAENFDIKFFADCENVNRFNKTSTCYHVKDKPVKFQVQITVKDIPFGKHNDTLYVEEKNINEKIELNIEYLGSCKCQNYDYKEVKCVHGFFRCGKCACEDGWSGVDCSEECNYDETSCRIFNETENTYSRICNNNGECVCGKCRCMLPFNGEYCQYECNAKIVGNDIQICGGSDKGTCFEGKCICAEGYTEDDCSCSTSHQECLFGTMDKLCSDNGDCVCNKCICRDDYTGQYCEISKYGGNNTICNAFESTVRDALDNSSQKIIQKDGQTVEIIDESAANEFSCRDDVPCTTIEYQGKTRCIFEYCYYLGDQNYTIAARKICTMTAGFKTIVSGLSVICAVVLLGIIAIAYYKYKIYKEDKQEYERFMDANKNAAEMNPIYRSPVTRYDNPLRAKSD